ncbi:conserved hypothetical protein [Talaromyces stipitatus ATCC 10500]|uniref:chitinase n=1 Tax=Talaromyces stipitatus (strain ATCC 10500 / CBS 375.48 / QM 6759 / NRRL 1006) TaxID=441959 RepID=B8MPH4_TALSN|nr:uncharacterized protein TSTA_106220 [Talaromyces stipitatus ATCC 10500]EED14413.1 conserved hypothetical protein [Talaromyces stipitatus ATCC 10500]
MHSLSKIFIAGALASTALAFPTVHQRDSQYKLTVYWGAEDDSTTLSDVCSDDSYQIVNLAFVSYFNGDGGYPTLSLSTLDGPSQAQQDAGATSLQDGSSLVDAIQACQSSGKLVLMSLGGGAGDSNVILSGDDQAKDVADMLWNLFGGGTDENITPLRPFGDVKLDGFDIDNESGDPTGYSALVSRLRSNFAQDTSKKYYLTAAPQCPYPDQSVPLDVCKELDYVWVQFYNNGDCDVAKSDFINSVKTWSKGIGNAKLFIGAVASDADGDEGYVDSETMASSLKKVEKLGLSNFGGAMLWEAQLAVKNDNYQWDVAAAFKLSREYGVSRKKLSRRWNGLPSRSTRSPTNRLLSLDQEKALILWIEYLDNIGAPPTNEQIEESANYLLAKDFTDPGEPPRAGKIIVQKPQERDWTTAEHYGEIERWFIDLKIAIQELKIVPQKFWNFDETGFIVGKGKDEAVVARLGGFDFNKNDFFEELCNIQIKIFTTRTIRHGWKERGIWPYDPKLILDKMPQPDEAFEKLAADGDTLKIYGEPDDTIPSSPTTKSISPPSSVAKLRRYINKIEKSVDGIKDILDSAIPGLSHRIKAINQGSLTLAELGRLYRESFIKVRDTEKRKQQKTTKRQVKAMGALYVKDTNRLIKRRHEGDLLRIHKSHILGVEELEQQEAPTEPGPTPNRRVEGGDATGRTLKYSHATSYMDFK